MLTRTKTCSADDEVALPPGLGAGCPYYAAAVRTVAVQDLLDAGHLDLSGCSLQGVSLGVSDIKKINLEKSDLRGADLSGVSEINTFKLKYSIYDLKTIWPENFNHRTSGSLGPGCDFSGQTISNADFRYLDLRKARFAHTIIHEGKFNKSKLAGASFWKADLKGADFRGANLVEVAPGGGRIDRACFNASRLWGADFTEANIVELTSFYGDDEEVTATFAGATFGNETYFPDNWWKYYYPYSGLVWSDYPERSDAFRVEGNAAIRSGSSGTYHVEISKCP